MTRRAAELEAAADQWPGAELDRLAQDDIMGHGRDRGQVRA
jgi:hypothetical protein